MVGRPLRPAALVVLLFLVPLVAGCLGETPTQETSPRVDDPYEEHPLYGLYAGLRAAPEVRFTTDLGDIRMLLYTDLMPKTAERFGALAESGFYDGTLIHRVVDDFVIQGGDPSKTGQFGSGETIPFEKDPRLHFGFGAVGLARDLDPDSGDSQWFVTERPAPHLHDPNGRTAAVFGTYALYAQVFDGMTTVRKVAAVPVVPGLDRPVEDVVVTEARLLPPPADIDPLHFPKRLEGAYHLGMGTAWLERPLHLFEGHPFPVTVVIEPAVGPLDEEPAPPEQIALTFQKGQGLVNATLLPTDDPWVFTAHISIPTTGVWQAILATNGVVAGPTPTDVLPLDAAVRHAVGLRE